MLSRLTNSPHTRPHSAMRAFSLVELLVVVSIIALLVGILLPSLRGARAQARAVVCAGNLRQLGLAFSSYATDQNDFALPGGYFAQAPALYWWGADGPAGKANFGESFIYPYLGAQASPRGVLECPDQPWGSYDPQSTSDQPTSTYGYNAYYLAPATHPAGLGGNRPWKRTAQIRRPADLFLFADTALDLSVFANPGSLVQNNCWLEPYWQFRTSRYGGYWLPNQNPTTCFRHWGGRTNAVHADGHADGYRARADMLTTNTPRWRIGHVGRSNDPHYVPDWDQWGALPAGF